MGHRNFKWDSFEVQRLINFLLFCLSQMMPHRNRGGLQWERDQDLGEYMQSWAWFQICCFLQLVLLTPCLLKLTDRAHCIKFQRCLFSAAKCPKRSSTQLPSSEKDTEPSDCLMVLERNICFIWSFHFTLKTWVWWCEVWHVFLSCWLSYRKSLGAH